MTGPPGAANRRRSRVALAAFLAAGAIAACLPAASTEEVVHPTQIPPEPTEAVPTEPEPTELVPGAGTDESPPETTVGAHGAEPGDTGAAAAAERALALVASETGIAASELEVVSTEFVEWPSGALGCPRPGQMYTQVITPGYRVVVAGEGRRFEVHTDDRPGGGAVLCSGGGGAPAAPESRAPSSPRS